MSLRTFSNKEKDGGWSYPSPVYTPQGYKTNGLVWRGKRPCTEQNIKNLADSMQKEVSELKLDKASLVGRWDAKWSSHYAATLPANKRMGGKGSKTYELQKVGKGVQFAKKRIWYRNAAGKLKKGIPGKIGEYHYVYDAYGREAHEGPKPGSVAEKRLEKVAGREYYWNGKNGWYALWVPK